MLSRSLGLATVGALGATAFLIPAGITPPEGLAISFVDPKSQLVQLPCAACAFPYENDLANERLESDDAENLFWAQGGANSILLNFTISDDQALTLGGETIYPLVFSDFGLSPAYVEQVPASAKGNEPPRTALLEVSGAAIMLLGEEELSPAGDVLISITYSIFSLGGQDMSLDEVSLKLLKTAEGELIILNIDTIPTPDDASFTIGLPFGSVTILPTDEQVADEFVEVSPPFDTLPEDRCGGLPAPICKVKNAIEGKINSFKQSVAEKKPGCGDRKGRLPTHIKPAFLHPEVNDVHGDTPAFSPPPFGGRPHRFHPHRGHGRHHRHRSFMHALAHGFATVIIPTMAGVAVGMTVSLMGLLAGRLIAFLWTRFRRGEPRNYIALASDEHTTEDNSAQDEKIVYAQEPGFETPPAYENVPAYRENA